MTPTIFVEQQGKLVPMSPHAYDTEDVLQALLASHPELLIGDVGDADLSYMLVRREAGIPDAVAKANRWSLDHLFLDREGVPTFVEVKRSTDTRIRREVVGQMLDYAANALLYWPMERIVEDFRTACAERGDDPDEILETHLDGAELSEDDFWQRVQTNLTVGRIRMLFVADEIPDELRRIVRFLNEQMTFSDVLAVEIKQYLSDAGVRTFVTNVEGATPAAALAKAPTEPGPKGKLYAEFWPPLMEMLREEVPGWLSSNKKPPHRHILALPSGRVRLWYGLQFTQDRHLQVTLFVRDTAASTGRFEALKSSEAALHEAFGGEFVWDKVPQRKRARISVVGPADADVERTEHWGDYREWLVGTSKRFRELMQPLIEALPQ